MRQLRFPSCGRDRLYGAAVLITAAAVLDGCATAEPPRPQPATAIFHHMASTTTGSAQSPAARQPLPGVDDPAAGFRSAMAAFTAGEYEASALFARAVIDGYPNTPWHRRALFLLGRTHVARNMTKDAEEVLLRVAAEYPDFADYALFTLAEHLRSRDRQLDAAGIWQRLITRHPSSLLVPRSLAQQAKALAEAGYSREAASLYEQVVRDAPRSESAPEAAFGLGSALTAAGDLQAAARAYRLAKLRYPSPDQDQAADRALAALAARGVELPRLTADELLERARNLYRAAQYDRAGDAYLAVLERDPLHPQKAEVLLRSGIALYYAGKRSEAASVLERLLKARPADCRCAEALHWIGKSYSRLGMRDDAVRAFQRLVRDYPDSDWADDALYLAGNVYRDAGDMKKALIYYHRLTADYPESSFADSALWWEGWSAYGARDHGRAIKVLGDIVRRYPRSFLVNQALYWQGRTAEASGDSAAAAVYYRRLMSHGPFTYYGTLAAKRLDQMTALTQSSFLAAEDTTELAEDDDEEAGAAADDAALFGDTPREWTGEAIRVLSANPSYRKTLELMYLDMKKEAAAELWSLLELMPGRSGAVLGLSKAFFELGDYHGSIVVVLRNFDRLLDRPSERLPEDLWLLAYPQGFWQSVTAAARKYGIDPFFVAAIIREESQFRPEAVSPAGARGVMQVMPSTAEWVARNAGMAPFDRSRLFEAETNIMIGTWYLSHLMKKFSGNLTLVSAAYNAGPEPVQTWAAKAEALRDPAVFVETIPYAETRGYVKKVLRNYAEYRRLYGNGASQRSAAVPGDRPGNRPQAEPAARVCRAEVCP